MIILMLFQVLDSARRRLSAVLQERSRVLDLVCAAMPSKVGMSSSSLMTRNHSHLHR